MKKIIERFVAAGIIIFSLLTLLELCINYFSFYYLFPIKNAISFGYIMKKTGKTIVPLNKYYSRTKAQLALPYELVLSYLNNTSLKKDYNNETKTFGYKDENGRIVIQHKFVEAYDFNNDYAIVAINVGDIKKYGTIDKHGNWIIEPKYNYMCPFIKYYTRACIDNKHCGVIDRYGNEITKMIYKTDKLKCEDDNCISKSICAIGKDNNATCNYFL